MNSNFHFISSPFIDLAITLKKVEQQVYSEPAYAAVLCRKSLEEWVRWLYENDYDLEKPLDTTLNTMMYQQEFKDLLAPSLFKQIDVVRRLGNNAVHGSQKVTSAEALHVLQIMHGFTSWVVRVYSSVKPVIPPFDASLVPIVPDIVKTKQDLKKLEDAFLHTQELNRQLREELGRLKSIKDHQLSHIPPPVDPNEKITREIYINLLLREAGWDVTAANVVEYPVKGMPTGSATNDGPGRVDYVLWGDDGKPLAVVEAKRTSRDARQGSNQAKLYADCLEQQFDQRPVIFYTNGFETWIWDDAAPYAPRRIYGFYKKDELALLIQRRTSKLPLSQASVDPNIADRYYQIEAIRSVGTLLENRGREALLVMATGSGKTRTAAALVDVLSKCNWAKRVLFLADRTPLIFQAKKSFTTLLPNLPNIDLTKEKDKPNARVVFCTYQTMINLIDGDYDNGQRYFGIAQFDVVIFDEIHRSVYNKYKAIFEYFDAFKIGLTATPKDEGDKDTYNLFSLQPGAPTFAYELDQAVKDKYLRPYFGKQVPIKFHQDGIKYADLTPDEKLEYEKLFADPLTGAFPSEINNTALHNWLFNTDTVDQVIGYLMDNGIKVSGGDRLGKTIIFARSHKHALFIKERFDLQYPKYGGHFCKVIDNYEEYSYDLLNKFSEKESNPHIAISVDMLDTGIDVPEAVNLVFLKTIKSKAKFWQMIGRGTRLCKDLFGPGIDKTHFLIFDFLGNFEFFDQKPRGDESVQGKSLSQRLFTQRLRLLSILQKQEDAELKKYAGYLHSYLFGQVQQLNDTSFLVRQHWREVEKYKDEHRWNALVDLDMKELIDHIGPLIAEADTDELAKRFDLSCYSMELDLLLKGAVNRNQVEDVQHLASKLTKKASVPAVAAKLLTLHEIQKKPYWDGITISGIEKLRTDLRDLMRFIDREDTRIVYSSFDDEVFTSQVKEHAMKYGANDLGAYRKKVAHYIKSKENHIVIHKLKTNVPITAAELTGLETMLFAQGEIGNREEFEAVYGQQPLGRFIRSIIGLDINAAKDVFGRFINTPALNPQQIRFVDTIIQYLTVNGTIETQALFERPFADISPNGLIDVFNQEQSAEIVAMLAKVNKNALVAV